MAQFSRPANFMFISGAQKNTVLKCDVLDILDVLDATNKVVKCRECMHIHEIRLIEIRSGLYDCI